MMMMETMSNRSGVKLRYCPTCHQVWEFDASLKKELKHSDFPAYGLQRDVCSECKNPVPSELFSQKTYVD